MQKLCGSEVDFGLWGFLHSYKDAAVDLWNLNATSPDKH